MRHAKAPSQMPLDHPAVQRLVTAARRHFFTHGIRSVTMDDLADELGMSKKTLYAWFPSKTALLQAMLRTKFQEVESDLQRVTADCSDVAACLHELLLCVQRHTSEIQPPFVRDIQREDPELFTLVESRRREIIQLYFGKLFEEGRRTGIIRKDVPTALIIEILLGAVNAILNPPKMMELGLTPKIGLPTIITVILEGVVTEAGKRKL